MYFYFLQYQFEKVFWKKVDQIQTPNEFASTVTW